MLQPHTLANDNRAATAGCNNLQLMPHNELTELGSVPVLLALLGITGCFPVKCEAGIKNRRGDG